MHSDGELRMLWVPVSQDFDNNALLSVATVSEEGLLSATVF
jgi:hypothetical protein